MNSGLRRGIVAAAAVLMLVAAVHAGTYESTSRRMAAGDFDNDGVNEVAYVRGGGIYVHDFNTPAGSGFIPGATATQITAADLDGNGVPEIAYINTGTGGLQSYNVATSTQTSYAYGSPFATLSANNADADVNHELLLLQTNDAVIRWDNAAGFTVAGGSLRQIGAGNFQWGATDYEFVGRNSGGAPYAYNWGVGYLGLGGGIAYMSTGNVIANDPGGEVLGGTPLAAANIYGSNSVVGTVGGGSVNGIVYDDIDINFGGGPFALSTGANLTFTTSAFGGRGRNSDKSSTIGGGGSDETTLETIARNVWFATDGQTPLTMTLDSVSPNQSVQVQ